MGTETISIFRLRFKWHSIWEGSRSQLKSSQKPLCESQSTCTNQGTYSNLIFLSYSGQLWKIVMFAVRKVLKEAPLDLKGQGDPTVLDTAVYRECLLLPLHTNGATAQDTGTTAGRWPEPGDRLSHRQGWLRRCRLFCLGFPAGLTLG